MPSGAHASTMMGLYNMKGEEGSSCFPNCGSRDYGVGGFFADIGRNRSRADAVLDGLKKNHWLDKRTAALGVDFSTYNANTRYLTIWRFVFEFQNSGNLVKHYQVRTTQMTMYAENRDFIRLGLEVVYAGMLGWMIVTLLLLIWKHHPSKAAIFHFWTIYDTIYYAAGVYALFMWLYYILEVTSGEQFNVNLDHFVDFYHLGNAFATTSRTWGVWFFLSMFRFLQYSEVVSEKMGALLLTLTQALWDLAVYVYGGDEC